jgi:hypothetical protein
MIVPPKDIRRGRDDPSEGTSRGRERIGTKNIRERVPGRAEERFDPWERTGVALFEESAGIADL